MGGNLMENNNTSFDQRPLFSCFKEKGGFIQNDFDWKFIYESFLESDPKLYDGVDVYFCFLIKTLISDFGLMLTHALKNPDIKKEFEAKIIENLKDMLEINNGLIKKM